MRKTLRFVLLPLVMLLFGSELLCSCTQLKDEARATAKDVIDCTTATAKAAIAEYSPTVEAVIVDAAGSEGKLDWERVKAATKTYASDAARCVLASTVQRLLRPPGTSSDAPQSSPLWLEPIAVARGWEDLRATQLHGVRFKLPDGTL